MLIRLLSALLAATIAIPAAQPADLLRSGALLRLHVIAQDDTPEMQAVKYSVRDAVQACYVQSAPDAGSMLLRARRCLPQLTEAARQAAREAGFCGSVSVTLELADFDERTLEGRTIPAGRYPALMVRLGDATGHNWWGLLDPEMTLDAAMVESTSEDTLLWDWSLTGLLRALLGWTGGDADA